MRSACAGWATSSSGPAHRGTTAAGDGVTDERTLLAGTGANVIGLAAGVVAAFGVQLLLGRSLPHGGLALVTVAVQFAFVAAAGARFGAPTGWRPGPT